MEEIKAESPGTLVSDDSGHALYSVTSITGNDDTFTFDEDRHDVSNFPPTGTPAQQTLWFFESYSRIWTPISIASAAQWCDFKEGQTCSCYQASSRKRRLTPNSAYGSLPRACIEASQMDLPE